MCQLQLVSTFIQGLKYCEMQVVFSLPSPSPPLPLPYAPYPSFTLRSSPPPLRLGGWQWRRQDLRQPGHSQVINVVKQVIWWEAAKAQKAKRQYTRVQCFVISSNMSNPNRFLTNALQRRHHQLHIAGEGCSIVLKPPFSTQQQLRVLPDKIPSVPWTTRTTFPAIVLVRL